MEKSHIVLSGNDMADNLTKEGTSLASTKILTLLKICWRFKITIVPSWRTSPAHQWYNGKRPGGAISFESNRVRQTTLISAHLKRLKFHQENKTFPICGKSNNVQSTPDHLVSCLGLDKRDLSEILSLSWIFWMYLTSSILSSLLSRLVWINNNNNNIFFFGDIRSMIRMPVKGV